MRGHLEVCYYFDDLEEVIESDDRIEEHEEGFWNMENIFHIPSRLWLKISNTIIANITNGSSSKWRKYQPRNDCFSVLGKLRFENW